MGDNRLGAIADDLATQGWSWQPALMPEALTRALREELVAREAAAALEALSILEEDDRANRKLAENITYFRAAAAAAGLPIMDSNTPIQPILIGEDVRAVGVAEGVCEDGFYVRAIRPPTVPDGSARIRITLSAAHQRRHLEDLASSMAYRLSI